MVATAGQPRDRVDVGYQWTERLSPSELAAAETILSDDERERRQRFHFERDRRDFAAAHALLRRMLSWHAPIAPPDWRFSTGPHGKPAVIATQAGAHPLSFNIAHTHALSPAW